jgi:hypothetical protein
MSRILLDQNVPIGVRRFLQDHDVMTAYRMGWADLSNGALLATMKAAGFDTLISCDRNLTHQQNLDHYRIAVLVLDTNRWSVLRGCGPEIRRAAAGIDPGTLVELSMAARGTP